MPVPYIFLPLSDFESNNNFVSMNIDDLLNHIYGDTDYGLAIVLI